MSLLQARRRSPLASAAAVARAAGGGRPAITNDASNSAACCSQSASSNAVFNTQPLLLSPEGASCQWRYVLDVRRTASGRAIAFASTERTRSFEVISGAVSRRELEVYAREHRWGAGSGVEGSCHGSCLRPGPWCVARVRVTWVL